MAKYCGHCGAKMSDSALVCGNCGVPFGPESTATTSTIEGSPQKQENSSNKIIKRCVFIGVIVIFAVVLFCGIFSHTGYRGLIRKVAKAYETNDSETILSNMSDFYTGSSASSSDLALLEFFVATEIEDTMESLEDSVGDTYRFSYDIDEVSELSQRKMDSMLNELEDSYDTDLSDFDFDSVKKIVVAELTFTATHNKETASVPLTLYLSKEDSGWKILIME